MIPECFIFVEPKKNNIIMVMWREMWRGFGGSLVHGDGGVLVDGSVVHAVGFPVPRLPVENPDEVT